jgi:alpha-1,2-mannosyltransferase
VLFSSEVLAFAWMVGSALALVAVLYRCGLRGWTLSAVASVVLVLCDPVRSTLTYGQVNLLLLALVVLDLVPGPAFLGRRPLLPKGVLTGLAAAIKLTPLLFAVFLWLARTRRAAIVAGATFVVCTLLAALVMPAASSQFVTGLLHGDTRTGGLHYIMNQSVLAAMSRVAGGGGWQLATGFVISAVVALAGAYAAALWYRQGSPLFAVSLCGIATILASPISWNHHLVWVVPLGVALLDRGLPYAIRATGWFLVGWVSLGPYKIAAPSTGDIELHWNAWQQLVVALTPIAGVTLVCLSLGYAWQRRRQPQQSV